MTNNDWSDALKRQTRALLSSRGRSFVAYDGFLHLKHSDDKFARMTLSNLNNGHLILEELESGEEVTFEDIDALINAGWAID